MSFILPGWFHAYCIYFCLDFKTLFSVLSMGYEIDSLRTNVLLSASSGSHSGIAVDPFKYDFLYPHHASFIKWGIISPLSVHFRAMQFTTESFKLNANFL